MALLEIGYGSSWLSLGQMALDIRLANYLEFQGPPGIPAQQRGRKGPRGEPGTFGLPGFKGKRGPQGEMGESIASGYKVTLD